jgi:hypothetical protein
MASDHGIMPGPARCACFDRPPSTQQLPFACRWAVIEFPIADQTVRRRQIDHVAIATQSDVAAVLRNMKVAVLDHVRG